MYYSLWNQASLLPTVTTDFNKDTDLDYYNLIPSSADIIKQEHYTVHANSVFKTVTIFFIVCVFCTNLLLPLMKESIYLILILMLRSQDILLVK